MMVSLEKKSEVTCIHNYVQHQFVPTIFIMDENNFKVDLRCFCY